MTVAAKDYATILADMKQELTNQNPDLSLQDDSDEVIRAKAVAAVVEGAYQHQKWVLRQLFAATAEKDFLDYHGQKVKVYRNEANTATGTLQINGAEGAILGTGAVITYSGLTYTTTASATIDSNGTADVAIIATNAGAAYNIAANTPVTLASAPSGINSQAIMVIMSGGTDQEQDDNYRLRVLYAQQNQDGAGNKRDYVKWATNVDGVAGVFVYPRRRGLGTVDVFITTSTGLPSPTLIANVQSAIDAVKPEPADCLVAAPTLRTINHVFHVRLQGITLEAVRPLVMDTVNAYYGALTAGDSVVIQQLLALVMGIDGVIDAVSIAPTANISPDISIAGVEWCVLGSVDVEVMV